MPAGWRPRSSRARPFSVRRISFFRIRQGGAVVSLRSPSPIGSGFPFSYTAHAGRVHDLVRIYSDLPASFADACLVRMAEVHDDARVFTVDSDVRVYQKHGRAPIPVLMPPSDGS